MNQNRNKCHSRFPQTEGGIAVSGKRITRTDGLLASFQEQEEREAQGSCMSSTAIEEQSLNYLPGLLRVSAHCFFYCIYFCLYTHIFFSNEVLFHFTKAYNFGQLSNILSMLNQQAFQQLCLFLSFKVLNKSKFGKTV